MTEPHSRQIPDEGFSLDLADGTRLAVCAGDAGAVPVVDFFARVARLEPAPVPLPPGTRRLVAALGGNGASGLVMPQSQGAGDVVCGLDAPEIQRRRVGRGRDGRPLQVFTPDPDKKRMWVQLTRLAGAISREVQAHGGVLLHSGLARIPTRLVPSDGVSGAGGVLLAGRSGVGKSTAGVRLPAPWRSRCDDATLVVRDPAGRYQAHPMPTWSRFFGQEAGDGSDTWDVQHAEPLRAIFILEQGKEDHAEPIGCGHAVSLLSELARQTTTYFMRGQSLEEIAAFHLQRFENLCALVRAVPVFSLQVSLGGAFWDEIGRVIPG